MQTFCESSDDVLKACAEVRKLYPHTPHDETNKVFVPMAKYAESHWDTLSQQARDAYDALEYWMMYGKEPPAPAAA